ncbi:MAG: hypothetical protein N2383_06215 [Caldilineales bacterium]|nr:hypothetical protein [Caldilineales bacterium]
MRVSPPETARSVSVIRRHGLILVLFAALTTLLTWPLARHLGNAIPGDAFDGWQNFWNLWWMRKALLEEHTHPYFTTALYHPTGVSLWFQTLNPFNGLVSLPVQLAGNLFWAYNAVVFLSFVLAGYGATLLAATVLGRLPGATPGRTWAAALTAGAVFTFSPFHFAHLLGHMQVFSLEWAPFFVLYLQAALRPQVRQRRRFVVLAAFFLVLAGLCDWYLVLYLGWLTLLYALWLAAGRRLGLSQVGAMVAIVGLFLLVMAPLLAPMVVESLRFDFMRPPPGQIEQLSADLLAFLLPSGQHPLWGDWAARLRSRLPVSPSESTLYLGLVAMALAVYGLYRQGRRLAFWAVAGGVFAVFALGPVLHVGGEVVRLPGGRPLPLPYALLLRLPFLEIARTVARYDLMVTLCLGLLAAGGVQALVSARGRLWPAGLALALVVFEYAAVPYPISPPDTPAWYHELARDPRPGAVLNLPMTWDRPNYLLFQTVHGKPLTAGYITRTDPRTYPERLPVLSDFRHGGPDINAVDVARYAAAVFAFADIRWVVVDRYQMPGGEERRHTEALVRAIFAGHNPVYEDERITVYETRPPSEPLPFIELGYDWGPRQPGPVRRLRREATFIVHSPATAAYDLVVSPAGVDLLLYDQTGQPVPPVAGAAHRFPLALQPGANRFRLQAPAGDVLIARLELDLRPSPSAHRTAAYEPATP